MALHPDLFACGRGPGEGKALAFSVFSVFVFCMCLDTGIHRIGTTEEERPCGPSVKAARVAPAGLISCSSIANSCVTLSQIPLPVYTSFYLSAKGDNSPTSAGYGEDEMNTHEGSRTMTHNCASLFWSHSRPVLCVSNLRLCCWGRGRHSHFPWEPLP